MEWKSINKIMVEVAIPETTARRYLATFSEFFEVQQVNKVKRYHANSGIILRRIAELYEQKKTTVEIKRILTDELGRSGRRSSDRSDDPQPSAEHEVRTVEAQVHTLPETLNGVSIEYLSQQNMLILATLQELAAGIKQINNQREEIAQLKREIKELRLQLVSVAQYQAPPKQSSWQSPPKLETRASGQRKPQANDEHATDILETSEHIDEVVPSEPVVLPPSVDRQQLADIIAELRANEPGRPAGTSVVETVGVAPQPVTRTFEEEAVHVPSASEEVDVDLDVPVIPSVEPVIVSQPIEQPELTPAASESDELDRLIHVEPVVQPQDAASVESAPTETLKPDQLSIEEASILFNRTYVPNAASEDENAQLSRVNSRSQRTKTEGRKWWQFWR